MGVGWSSIYLEIRHGYVSLCLSLLLDPNRRQKNLLWVADLEKEQIGSNFSWIKLVDDFEAEYSVYAIDYAIMYIS